MTLRIDGKEITPEAVDYELKRLVQFYSSYMPAGRIQDQMETLAAKAKEQAIGTALLLRDARNRKIPIPDSEVEQAFDQIVSDTGGQEAMDAALAKQGLNADEIRSSIIAGKQVDRLVAEITSEIPEPTEGDILEYFEAHSEDYSSPERASAQHILITPESDSDDDREVARQKLEDIRKEFENGADFGELAAEHSDCESGPKAGGQLGWIHRGTMVPQFEEALFATPVGELSPIVETPLGLHIILPADHQEEQVASFEQAKEMVRALLSHSIKGNAISDYTEKLKAGVLIEDD